MCDQLLWEMFKILELYLPDPNNVIELLTGMNRH